MKKAISQIDPIYDPIQPLDGKINSPTFVLRIFSPVLCSLFYVSQLPSIIGPYPDYSAVMSWIINEHVVCFGTPADLLPLTHWWLITGVDMEWQLTAFILSIFVTALKNNDKGKKTHCWHRSQFHSVSKKTLGQLMAFLMHQVQYSSQHFCFVPLPICKSTQR